MCDSTHIIIYVDSFIYGLQARVMCVQARVMSVQARVMSVQARVIECAGKGRRVCRQGS